MTGTTMFHSALGVGIGSLAVLGVLAAFHLLGSTMARWLLLAGAIMGGVLGFFLSRGSSSPAASASPAVANNVRNVPDIGVIQGIEQGNYGSINSATPGAFTQPVDNPIANVLSGTWVPGASLAQNVQYGVNSGIAAMQQSGTSALDAKTMGGMVAIVAAPQIVPQNYTAQDILDNVRIVVTGNQPPASSYRPLNDVTVIDASRIYNNLVRTNNSQNSMQQDGAYIHNGTVAKP